MGDDRVYRTVIRSASYSYRAPSPPKIHIPIHKSTTVILQPSYDLVDPRQIDREEYDIITDNRAQVSVEQTSPWKYEQRREAQRILDFVYLGPTSIVRDHEFLRREAVTLLVIVRNAQASFSLPSINNAASALNIGYCYIDIEPNHLVNAFYKLVGTVNSHMLSVHRDSEGSSRGRVLVACDSGNILSSSLVIAYIMFMYGKDMNTAAQFVIVRRFCVTFFEEAKQAFMTWESLNKAGVTVAARSSQVDDHAQAALANGKEKGKGREEAKGKGKAKRDLDDMMEDVTAEDEGSTEHDTVADQARFQGRRAFAPFMDIEMEG